MYCIGLSFFDLLSFSAGVSQITQCMSVVTKCAKTSKFFHRNSRHSDTTTLQPTVGKQDMRLEEIGEICVWATTTKRKTKLVLGMVIVLYPAEMECMMVISENKFSYVE